MIETFIVNGDPAAQGSKRLVQLPTGRTVMLEQSAKVKPWRSAVAAAAVEHGCVMRTGDLRIRIVLFFARPKSHYGKAGILPSAPARPGYVDVDKAARAILDALAGVCYANDRQVAILQIERMWVSEGIAPGAVIQISEAPPPENLKLTA